MTDTSTAQPLASSDSVPDIGFTVEQLQFLLSLVPHEAAQVSADVLNVSPVPSKEETARIGGASLLANGNAEINSDGGLLPVGSALVVAYILSRATRWTVMTGADDSHSDIGVFVESPDGGLLAQPRMLGTWWFIILDPASSPVNIITDATMGLALQWEESGVLSRAFTAESDRTFSLRRRVDEWAFAVGNTEADAPELMEEQVSRDRIVAELRRFVSEFPAGTGAE